MGEDNKEKLYNTLTLAKEIIFNIYSPYGNVGASGVFDDVTIKRTPASIIISEIGKEDVNVILSVTNEAEVKWGIEDENVTYVDISYNNVPIAISLVIIH